METRKVKEVNGIPVITSSRTLEGAPCADEGATYIPKTDVIATPGTGDQATYNKARKQE
jgi:hypothetical protein